MFVYVEPHYCNVDAIIKFAFVSTGIDFKMAGDKVWCHMPMKDPSYEAFKKLLLEKSINQSDGHKKSRFEK